MAKAYIVTEAVYESLKDIRRSLTRNDRFPAYQKLNKAYRAIDNLIAKIDLDSGRILGNFVDQADIPFFCEEVAQ